MMLWKNKYCHLRENFENAPAQFEQVIQEVYTFVLKAGGVVLDCGAHKGKHSLPMAECVGKKGLVICFEPIAEKLKLLEDAAFERDLHQIRTLNMGVGNQLAIETFTYVPDDPGKSSFNLRDDLVSDERKMRNAQQFEIPITTIDLALIGSHECGFIKLDVEGAEYTALQGAEKSLARYRPVVHFELADEALSKFGAKPIDIFELAKKHKYDVFDVLGNHLDTPEQFNESAFATGVYDYFLVPNGSFDLNMIADCSSNIFTN